MADGSKIEWTDATWNPIRARNRKTGQIGWHCEHATTGCVNCYAEGLNLRLGTGLPFKPGHLKQDVELFLDQDMLLRPLSWKRPRMIFVCSMTDLFAGFVPDEWIDQIFAAMALTPQHTYQVLTKRANRMLEYMAAPLRKRQMAAHTMPISCMLAARGGHEARIKLDHFSACFAGRGPFPNVWLGVSAERQEEADARIPHLLQTPAAVRFISAEPLLGPIDLNSINRLQAGDAKPDWVIAGGESGPKARPMHPDWARRLRDQCKAAGVPFFFKQWGEWAPSTPEEASGNPRSGWKALAGYPHVAKAAELYPEASAAFVARVGKKKAGRLLDGVEHNEFPAATGRNA